jgi:hypothetical protein
MRHIEALAEADGFGHMGPVPAFAAYDFYRPARLRRRAYQRNASSESTASFIDRWFPAWHHDLLSLRAGGCVPYSPDMSAMLTEGARFEADGIEYVIERLPVGTVTVPTGEITACDPLTYSDGAEPFTVTITPGAYPLTAWVALISQDGSAPQQRTAALQLTVNDQPAVRWEMALNPGQDIGVLDADTGYYGYPVDAGVGAIADVTAIAAVTAWDYDDIENAFIPAQIPNGPAPIEAITDDTTGANVIIVSSGWGDGVYPTFVGYAADGAVCGFVTDFLVIPD